MRTRRTYANPFTADDTLGPCGCTDYHLADCPLMTAGRDADEMRDPYD